MLDIKLIREKSDEVKAALLKREIEIDFSDLLRWDAQRRQMAHECDQLRAQRSKESSEIPILLKQGKPIEALQKAMQKISEQVDSLAKDIHVLDKQIADFLDALPNLPDPDVVAGGKENNTVLRQYGEKPSFSFKPKDHVELVKSLRLVDYERGVRLGGNGYWLYCGDGAKLEWGLLNYFMEQHIKDGYEPIMLPHILTQQCGYTAGQFPKFADDVFKLEGESMHFLLPTAETALVNLHRDEILSEQELPKKYFAYTPCYRKEAGSYRANERGMIRGHQFNKVEMFQFAHPDQSAEAFLELVKKAEVLLQGLGLHYRLVKLAAQDCSAGMAKTFDLEVWIPSMNEYKEVSSVSNARDFQSRRGNIRFKRKETMKNEFVHTLNGSGLATSRLLPAIVEQNQREDGSVVVPEPLRKWVMKDILR